jgi:hypothetical protein
MPARFFLSFGLLRLAVLALAVTVFAGAPAFAQEDDNEPNELQKVFGAMGLLELPKDPIDYSERSPLVVPPSAELPKPGEVDAKQLNPEWPTDQDVKRKRAAAKEAKKPIDFPTDSFYNGSRLRNTSKVNGAVSKDSEVMTESEKLGLFRVSPDKLGFKGWDKKNDEIKFEHEPARTSLLQPPPGYQTPSPNAPYGIVDDSKPTVGNYDRNYDKGDVPNRNK